MFLTLDQLTPSEKRMYELLTQQARTTGQLRITEAAQLCGCSSSKISKFVKKLGFTSFKQFVQFALGNVNSEVVPSDEIQRLMKYLQHFDRTMVDVFLEQVDTHSRIILLGYGPSFYCAQYLEYKFRLHSDKFVVAVPDLITAQNQITEDSLLVIFTATGQFTSFQEISRQAGAKGGDVILIMEEYRPEFLNNYSTILFLTRTTQDSTLQPYEKSRSIFFIFIEEIIFQMMKGHAAEKMP